MTMHWYIMIILAAAVTGAPQPAALLTGRVVGVADGDTLTVRATTETTERVRLAGIDAPESKQAFSRAAREALAQRVMGRDVVVRWRERDKYGRVLGDVLLGTAWINHDLVAAGWAWHFTKYSSDQHLAAAERRARDLRLGLWQDAAPIPPWTYRAERAAKRAKVDVTDSIAPRSAATGERVHVTTHGKKYHRADCRYLKDTQHTAMTPDQARAAGLEPCRACQP